MSTQELKEELHKRIDSVEDDKVLKQALAILKGDMSGLEKHSSISIEKHLDVILKEDENLLRRLAE